MYKEQEKSDLVECQEAQPIRDLSKEVNDLKNHLNNYSVEEILRIFNNVKSLINKEKQEIIHELNKRQIILEKELKMLQS